MKYEALKSRDQKLQNNWYIACLSSELKKKVIARTLYDTPLAFFRDSRGVAHALLDQCLHRGTLLSEGTVTGDCLQCPYHGWRYNGDAKVTHIPSEGPGTQPLAKLCQKAFHLVEQDCCVWIWMGEGAPATLAPPFRFPHQSDSKWHNYFMVTDFQNEVTHLAENFMDVPHTVFVHSGWFRTQSQKKIPIEVKSFSAQVLVTYKQTGDSIGFSQFLINPKKHDMQHTDHFIMPNITKVDYLFGDTSGFVIISQITPVSTLESRVYTFIAYKLPIWGVWLKIFFKFYTRRVIEQDVKIMEIQGRSFRLHGESKFHSTGADIVHLAIERLRNWGKLGDAQLHEFKATVVGELWI